jgi:acetyl-CoA carboxylase biotin carboxyl carrier protein
MSTPRRVTLREIQELLRTFGDSGWAAMTLELDGVHVAVGKHGPPAASARAATAPVPDAAPAPDTPAPPATPAPSPPEPTPAADTAGCVEARAPAIGTFWVAPSPGEPPFVQVGQSVDAGQQLAVVEVMKLMNPVIAPQAGEIVRVCAANAELVEFDQPLFLIRPADG